MNDKSKLADLGNTHTIIQRDNPHKYVLYKPSFSQFFTYISSAFKDLPPHGIMLVYISADSSDSNGHHNNNDEREELNAYEAGGVKTNNRKELSSMNMNSNNNSLNKSHLKSESSSKLSSTYKDTHCIYPGDLYPFLRKPLFLIIDSANSAIFQVIIKNYLKVSN